MAVPKAPIKFRCFQCHKLLGISRARIGTVVSCPKCGTELVVPDPSESETAVEPESTAPPSPLAGLIRVDPDATTGAKIDPEAETEEEDADDFGLRPEDIRVEPGRWGEPKSQVPTPAPFEAPGPPQREIAEPPPPFAEFAPLALETEAREPPPTRQPDEGAAAAAPELPLIRIEAPASGAEPLAVPTTDIGERRPAPRHRDVIMPRTAVVAWSLFALLGLGLAFTAGLLVGHFLWIEPS